MTFVPLLPSFNHFHINSN